MYSLTCRVIAVQDDKIAKEVKKVVNKTSNKLMPSMPR